MARQRVLKFTRTKKGEWKSSLNTRAGVLTVHAHKRFQNNLKEGAAYLCKLNKLHDNTFMASDIKPIEENPSFSYYVDSSKLGVFISVIINGEEETALGVFYNRLTGEVEPKVATYTSALRDSLIKAYKVSDTDIEQYRKVTSKRYLSNLDY